MAWFRTVLEIPEGLRSERYRWLEHDHPALFERVRERVRSRQWEATGAMWVEPDTNLVSGESLVRQLLWGRRYFRETFGVDSRVLWLPDVFGYSALLPQILAKCSSRRRFPCGSAPSVPPTTRVGA